MDRALKIDDLQTDARKVQHLMWAADRLLLQEFRTDRKSVELIECIWTLIRISEELSARLAEQLDKVR